MVENQFVVGWGTLALINAGLAQGKNRKGINWFLLSLLLGPFSDINTVSSRKIRRSIIPLEKITKK